MKFTKPSSAHDYWGFAFLCAMGSVWSLWDYYHAFHFLPLIQGVSPMLQGYGSEEYAKYPFEVRQLVTTYGYSQIPDHFATPLFVIYLRIALHFCFWTASCILLTKYSSTPDRASDACRLIGTLTLGLVIIDESVRLQVRGEAYRHLFLSNSFGTFGEAIFTMIIVAMILLLLTPWPRFFHIGKYKVTT